MILPKNGFTNCKAVSTTDLVTHPESFLSTKKKVVLISFARSGNSPESIGTVNIANEICDNIVHIFITCNKDGELAKMANPNNTLLLLLPPETNDVSLAMTSSFSTMMLACLLVMNIFKIEDQLAHVQSLSRNTQNILDNYASKLKEIAERQFKRAIFLGSGELKGIAEECHLKLQELTDGNVICKYESFMGFRHGPKAVINERTILIYLFSDDDYVFQYEKDLVEQINSNNQVVAQIAVSQSKVEFKDLKFDLEVVINNDFSVTSEYDSISYVLVGQLLGYYKSMALGLNPDNPSISGNISRVVEGVTIYKNELQKQTV
jgi:tagatose-6-phosphate ketose/aldose isomerase